MAPLESPAEENAAHRLAELRARAVEVWALVSRPGGAASESGSDVDAEPSIEHWQPSRSRSNVRSYKRQQKRKKRKRIEKRQLREDHVERKEHKKKKREKKKLRKQHKRQQDRETSEAEDAQQVFAGDWQEVAHSLPDDARACEEEPSAASEEPEHYYCSVEQPQHYFDMRQSDNDMEEQTEGSVQEEEDGSTHEPPGQIEEAEEEENSDPEAEVERFESLDEDQAEDLQEVSPPRADSDGRSSARQLLFRKRKITAYIEHYVPPPVKRRLLEMASWEAEKSRLRQKLEQEDAAGGPAVQRTIEPNIRWLARKWEPRLEMHGSCCFNMLQKDPGIDIDDLGIRAECVAAPLNRTETLRMGPGIKGLPTIDAGRYQFEVELLKDCAIMVGWSAATSLPSCFDFQAFGYSSNGCRVTSHDGRDMDLYGPSFGRKGDIVGVLIVWPPRISRRPCPVISFMLNGKHLGEAFDLSEWCGCMSHPALQPHLCQAPGPAFHVLLRGASPAAPLVYPAKGYAPLGQHLKAHFCPFSQAVEKATDANSVGTPTIARRLIHGSLGVQIPLSHLAQERQIEGRCR